MKLDLVIGRLGVAVAVVCATAVTVTAVAMAMPSVRTSLGLGPTPLKPSYVAGQPVDLSSDVFGQASQTLAIFFRSDCGACERMKPYLTRLVARNTGTALRVVAVTGVANSSDSLAFAKAIGVDESRLITMDLSKLRLQRVPTILLIDRSGRIENALEGIPSAQDEESLLRKVTALSQSH